MNDPLSGTSLRPLGETIYVSAEGFERELLAELGPDARSVERLVFAPGPARPAAWAANVWHDPVELRAETISLLARGLRSQGSRWAPYAFHLHRRTALVAEGLRRASTEPLPFPCPAEELAWPSSFALLDATTAVAARRCSSPFPHGIARFREDRVGPPSRAYLKLWEALTLLERAPVGGERCLDLGSSPGGWTWVLASLGADVLGVDRAPLAPRVAQLPNVEHRVGNAFSALPSSIGRVDWLFSDVICYPDALYDFVMRWLASGLCERFVCTLKFQGETDHQAAARFAAIPGSTLRHLSANRHELTWFYGVPFRAPAPRGSGRG